MPYVNESNTFEFYCKAIIVVSRLLTLLLSLFLLAPCGAAAQEVCKEEAQENLELSINEFVRHETRRQFSVVPVTKEQKSRTLSIPTSGAPTARTLPAPDNLIIRIRRLRI